MTGPEVVVVVVVVVVVIAAVVVVVVVVVAVVLTLTHRYNAAVSYTHLTLPTIYSV